MITTHADTFSRVDCAAALTGDNHACFHLLPTSQFKPQALTGTSGVLSGFAALFGFGHSFNSLAFNRSADLR